MRNAESLFYFDTLERIRAHFFKIFMFKKVRRKIIGVIIAVSI